MSASVTLHMIGVPRILEKLRAKHLYQARAKAIMEDVLETGVKRARRRAPKDSGRLAESISGKMDAAPFPGWAKIELARVTSPRGYPYGYALNASERYYYRRRGRRPTHLWFRGVQKGIRGRLNFRLRRLGRDISKAWRQ